MSAGSSPVAAPMPTPSRFVIDEQVARAASIPFAYDADHAYLRLARSSLALQSSTAREVIARLVDPDTDTKRLVAEACDATSQVSLAGSSAPASPSEVAPGVLEDARLRCTLAWATGLLGTSTDDVEASIALYRHARQLAAPAWPLSRLDARALSQMLFLTGRHEELAADVELLEFVTDRHFRPFLDMDIEGARSGVGSDRWLSLVNGFLAEHGVGPITLDAEGDRPFDRLAPGSSRRVDGGPLVTVIMPAFKPTTEIVTGVRSIIDQTWSNLELLVVDDCSGPEHTEIFDHLETMDPRIRIIRQPKNRGTYAARNRALDEAKGEFITFQDVDDWSHPERIERQLGPLLEDPHLLRSLSRSVRCRDDLTFQYLGYLPVRSNASSHLFRRSLLAEAGRFDWVRKSADTEFDRRLEAAFPGRRAELNEVLAFIRLQTGSLSRGDFRPGWMHPARKEYRASMFDWHDRVAMGESPLFPQDVTVRPLTAPRPFLRSTGFPAQQLDVVFAADWHLDGASERAAADEMRALASAGVRVGVTNMQTLRSFAIPTDVPSAAIRRLIRDGTVTFVSLEEEDHVPTLVVRHPEPLEYPTERPVALTVDRVIIVADTPSVVSTDAGPRWTVADCEHNAEALFGVRPQWLVAPGVEVDVPEESRAGTFPEVLWAPRPISRPRGDRPILGWITDDDGSGLPPDDVTLSQVYPTTADVDVRLVGARRLLKQRLGGIPAQWLVYKEGTVTTGALWHQVDFAVGFPNATDERSCRRAVLEAMAAGCVVVLPHEFAGQFGNAAVYCAPDQVAELVRTLHADRAAFTAQMHRGIAFAESATGELPRKALRSLLAIAEQEVAR